MLSQADEVDQLNLLILKLEQPICLGLLYAGTR